MVLRFVFLPIGILLSWWIDMEKCMSILKYAKFSSFFFTHSNHIQ